MQNSRIAWLFSLDVPCGHLSHEPQHAVLEIVLLERNAATEATLLHVERLGVQAFLGAVPRDETRLSVVTVDL